MAAVTPYVDAVADFSCLFQVRHVHVERTPIASQTRHELQAPAYDPVEETNAPKLADSELVTALLVLACMGAVLHGVAMALRKHYGQGHGHWFWVQWRWWIAALVDVIAGLMLYPAYPIVSVELLIPLIIVIQLVSCYVIALTSFNESATWESNLGLACAAIGIVGISMSTGERAAFVPIDTFWSHWVTIPFLMTNVAAILLLVSCFFLSQRPTFWGILAGVIEGVHYICSRSIAEAVYESKVLDTAVQVAMVMKLACLIAILHCSQLGLESNMLRFSGVYLLACTASTCVYGVVFFGEIVEEPVWLAIFLCFTLVGIWLLNLARMEEPAETMTKELDAAGEHGKQCSKSTEEAEQ